jgi:flavin reductase (DIM6/NTAB) family NADH-FMN oxidoreductase RutF
MNQTSIHLPYGEDEMPNAGLEGEASKLVKPLRVKNAPVHLECKYMQSIQMPCWHEGRENWVIFGEVVGIHVDPKIIKDGLVDVTLYQPVSRLGYMDYSAVTELFQMDRPGLIQYCLNVYVYKFFIILNGQAARHLSGPVILV